MKKLICVLLVLMFCFTPLMAEGISQHDLDQVNAELDGLGKGLCIGLAVSGAAAGIGMLVTAGLEGMARQPEMYEDLNTSMNTGIIACVGLAIGAIVATLIL